MVDELLPLEVQKRLARKECALSPPDNFDHAWRTSNYLSSYIHFADAKAGFLVALATLSLGLIAALPGNLSKSAHLIITVTSIPTIVALVIALWSVRPRTTLRASKGTIFWENIWAHEGPRDYIEAVQTTEPALEVLRQNYYLAGTVRQKYNMVRRATTLMLYGLPIQWATFSALVILAPA